MPGLMVSASTRAAQIMTTPNGMDSDWVSETYLTITGKLPRSPGTLLSAQSFPVPRTASIGSDTVWVGARRDSLAELDDLDEVPAGVV